MENNSYHTPVMLQQSLEGLAIRPEGTYVDVTLGGGGAFYGNCLASFCKGDGDRD